MIGLLDKFKPENSTSKEIGSKNGVVGKLPKDRSVLLPHELVEIQTSLIKRDPFQARKVIKDDDFEALKESIKSSGLQVPIHVLVSKNGRNYTLKSGERRLTAIEELGITKVPAFLITDPIEAAMIAVSSNAMRKDIHPVNMGIWVDSIFKTAKEEGERVTIAQIATFLNKAESTIREWYRYLLIHEDIRKEIEEKNIRSKVFLRKVTSICIKAEKIKNLSDSEKAQVANEQVKELLNSLNEKKEGDTTSEVKTDSKVSNEANDLPETCNFLYWKKKNDEVFIRDSWKKLSKKQKKNLLKKIKLLEERITEDLRGKK